MLQGTTYPQNILKRDPELSKEVSLSVYLRLRGPLDWRAMAMAMALATSLTGREEMAFYHPLRTSFELVNSSRSLQSLHRPLLRDYP